MEYDKEIPEAIAVPRPDYSGYPPAKPPKQGGGWFKGFFFGCLGCVLILFLIFALGIGSCAYMVAKVASSEGGIAENAIKENTPVTTLLRSGSGSKKIAVINVHGTITRESVASSFLQEETGASALRICRELRSAQNDGQVVAVILDMDTPGGEVVASDEIRSAVDALTQAGKPVVTCMHTMAASGGYFIASGSDWIVANRLTLTGSVGVIMQSMELSKLMQKLGIEPVTYRSGNFKDIMSPMRAPTPEEDEYLNAMVKQDFREFCQVIANGRPNYFPTVEEVLSAPFADGRVLSGADALEYHLIDELGDLDTAIAKARELAQEDAPVYSYSLRRDWYSRLFTMLAPRPALDAQALDRLLPAATLQPGVRYYILPQAAR